MLAGQEAGEDRVADPGGRVDLIERRTKAVDFGFVLSNRGRILIGNPTRIDAIHVDAVASVILGGRSRQHVEGGFGHVGVRVFVRLEGSVKNPLHRGHVDDVLVAGFDSLHQRFESGIENERSDRVDELNFEQFHRRDIRQAQPPTVDCPEVNLLQIAVEFPGRKEFLSVLRVSGSQWNLR